MNVEILITGAGIPNTILKLSNHLHKNQYDLIINIGVCGSFNKEYKIGDVVEIINDQFSEIGYEDNNTFHAFDTDFRIDKNFSVSRKTRLRSVNGITVNTVHGNAESIEKVRDLFNPDVESMEGAACMMVSQYFNVSFIQIRGISNYVEKRNKQNWNLDLDISNLNKELRNTLNTL